MTSLVVLAFEKTILLVVVEELRDRLELDSNCKGDFLKLTPSHHGPIKVIGWETPSKFKNLLLLERKHPDPLPFLRLCWRPLKPDISLLGAQFMQ